MHSRNVSGRLLALSLCAIASFTTSTGARAAPPPRGAACLPKTTTNFDPYVRVALHLAQSGDAWLICSSEQGVGPKACWEVDRKKGTLTPHVAELVPGISYRVLAEGCVAGLCMPKPPAPTNPRDPADGPREAFLSVHADGKRAVALVEGHAFVVFDRKTQEILASFELRGPPTGDFETIGNVPVSMWFLGETIFVEGMDAGPGAYVGSYRADGTPIGIVRATGSETYLDTYRGHVSALDATHLGISADGLTALHAVSGANGGIDKTVARKLPKAPCDVYSFYDFDAEAVSSNGANAACRTYIKKNLAAWQDVQLVADGDRFLAFDPSRAQLIELDASLVAKRRVSLKRCAK